jgi:hypothetical protein
MKEICKCKFPKEGMAIKIVNNIEVYEGTSHVYIWLLLLEFLQKLKKLLENVVRYNFKFFT